MSDTPRTDAACMADEPIYPRLATFARDLERENARLLVGNARYEYVRRLNAAQFAELYRRNITEGVPFDDLIDAARKEAK